LSKDDVVEFIESHHLLSLCTCRDNEPWSASCFYAFDKKNFKFIISSDKKTKHLQNLLKNPKFSATIALETKEIGKIQGVQISGVFKQATLSEKALYLKNYPFALALNPTLWSLHVKQIKYTDNRLGFGKKLEFEL